MDAPEDRPDHPTGPGSAGPQTPGDAPRPDGVAGGQVLDHDIRQELQDSYLTYAMSTIMDRALPDVRDGLKPSQRRILVAMNDLNLRPGRKHLKCAKIAGNTSGDYHPHGEAIVYPTLVGMAQKWRMRVPLIDPQGNFGSINGDPPAAMRYTEARMTHAAVDMLADLKLDTVDFQPNYDDRLLEPTVLPGRFPNLLINGGIGIAVGMATSLPPHNPVEVFDSIIRVLENPAITLGELMNDVVDAAGAVTRRGIKGPDFPTGGLILGKRGIVEAYASGRGRIVVRGATKVEAMEGRGERQQLVIDEIPYNSSQELLLKKIVEAYEEDKIPDISDVRDESGRQAPTRIVIELKRGADPAVVEKQLYEFTSLQDTFSIMNIALVNRQPRTLGLLELINLYIDHRREVIRRRTSFLLREARRKAHELEGLVYAVCDIDEVIRIIRSSRTREEAIQRLMDRRFRIPPTHEHYSSLPQRLRDELNRAEVTGGVELSRKQAEGIGGMRLIQLVGLEIQRLVEEYNSVVAQIEDYESILADEARVRAIIREDCEEMRARYGAGRLGERLTRIEDGDADIAMAELIPQEDVALTISHAGYAKRVPLSTYRSQGRGGKGIRASDTKDDDFIEHLFVASTHDDLLCFTNTGRVFKIKVFEVPELSRTSKGRAMVNLLDLKEGERTCAYLAVKNFEEGSNYLTFVSRGGIVKRTALKDYRNISKAGLIAVGLKEGDQLLDVTLTDGNDDLLLVTANGMSIRFDERDARLMGRQAAGVKGIELEEGDEVIGVVRVAMDRRDGDESDSGRTVDTAACLLTITEHGYGKRTPVDEYRVQSEDGSVRSQSRGGKGRVDIRVTEKNGRSVAALLVHPGDGLVVITKGGQLVRTATDSIREVGRGTQGVRVVSLNDNDKVISAAVAPEEVSTGDVPATVE
ncbi:MAG: DNA gyrase subunit A [Phycisphaerales bacterium]|nr:DNA gyrase subunit A [Phycisphaerales bacterium]